jgi:hypothetical protein
MMTAEKAADMILGKTPSPPEHVDFYRHERTARSTVGVSGDPAIEPGPKPR